MHTETRDDRMVTILAALLVVLVLLGGAGFLMVRWRGGAIAQAEAAREAAALAEAQASVHSDREMLQGAWTYVSGESDGEPLRGELVRSLTVTGNRVSWLSRETLVEDGVLEFDPQASPRTLDISFQGLKYLHWSGIYRLDGDRLTICLRGFYAQQSGRPAAFTTARGSRTNLVVLKKEPAEARDDANEQQMARRRSNGKLVQLACAMHQYHDEHDHFPPPALLGKEGKPLLSWRVSLLPTLGLHDLYQQFKLDEPWDSPANKALLPRMPAIYASVVGTTKEPHATYYQVFVGPGAAFEEGKTLKYEDFTDGTSNTLLVTEGQEAVPWTKPAELSFDPDKPLPPVGGSPEDGLISFAAADGAIHTLPRGTDERFRKLLRALITRNGEENIDWDEISK